MSEETNKFRPDNNAPAKQHLVDAALDELRQRGTGDATDFLDQVNEQLDQIDDQQPDIIPITSKPKSKLYMGIGLAAALAASLFVVQFYFANQYQSQDISAVEEMQKELAAPPFPASASRAEDKQLLAETASSVENFKKEKLGQDVSTLRSNPLNDSESASQFSNTDAISPAPVPSSPSLAYAPTPQKLYNKPSNELQTRNTGTSLASRFPANESRRQIGSDRVAAPTEPKATLFKQTGGKTSLLKIEEASIGGYISESRAERYDSLVDNSFLSPLKNPLSTFSVDVDTASYTNIRRMINSGQTPPKDAVRIEEMINYFSYDYPQPEGEHPFSFAIETANSPWNTDHQLLRVGIQGKKVQRDKRPAANLVFLLDVSGSMSSANKLPLVKKSMALLVEELNENDTLSIVVYSGAEGLCLPPTKGDQNTTILKSLEKLGAGGSTNGGAGIQLAYKVAKENFKKDGINRVILCTDGDFNVGRTEQGSLVSMVENKAKQGTFLTVLGFGSGNINDAMLEAITNKGNGNYYYIDSIEEGRKVLLQDLMSTLVTIAKDVKIQIEFNPKHVQSYRLIGYANRQLDAEDFINDKVDAGEVGAGHSVTALYEIVPAGAPPIEFDVTQNLKYQKRAAPAKKTKLKIVDSDELCTVKLRYKKPDSDKSQPIEQAVTYQSKEWQNATDDYQFAAAVALWGMQLRDVEHISSNQAELILALAQEGSGADPFGRREEFIKLVKKWQNQ